MLSTFGHFYDTITLLSNSTFLFNVKIYFYTGPLGDAIENMLKYDTCEFGDGTVRNTRKKNVLFLTPAVGYMHKERFDVTTCVCGLNLCDSGNNQPHPREGMYCNNGTSWCSMSKYSM